MVATGELAQQLTLAIVELVVAKRADHVAALLGEGLGAAGQLHLPAERTAERIGQQVEQADRRFVAQQGGVGWRGADLVAVVNDEGVLAAGRSEVGRQHRRAACRPSGNGARRQLTVEVVDAEDVHRHHRLGAPIRCAPAASLAGLLPGLQSFLALLAVVLLGGTVLGLFLGLGQRWGGKADQACGEQPIQYAHTHCCFLGCGGMGRDRN